MADPNYTESKAQGVYVNGAVHRLGSLCRRGHDHAQTGKSLRYLFGGACVDCVKARNRRPEELARQREYKRLRRQDPEYVAAMRIYDRKWRERRSQDPDIKARKRERAKKHRLDPAFRERERRRRRERERMSLKCPAYRLKCNMSRAIRKAIRGGKMGRSWKTIFPFAFEDLLAHLESQFSPDMNWENYGSYWNLDHIIPVSAFAFSSPDDPAIKKAWSLSNLRPLKKSENFAKNNSLVLRS
jgi:hypothetical protein